MISKVAKSIIYLAFLSLIFACANKSNSWVKHSPHKVEISFEDIDSSSICVAVTMKQKGDVNAKLFTGRSIVGETSLDSKKNNAWNGILYCPTGEITQISITIHRKKLANEISKPEDISMTSIQYDKGLKNVKKITISHTDLFANVKNIIVEPSRITTVKVE